MKGGRCGENFFEKSLTMSIKLKEDTLGFFDTHSVENSKKSKKNSQSLNFENVISEL